MYIRSMLKTFGVWLGFVVLVLLSFLANESYKTFFYRPCSAHVWRQCDGASYALNYHQNKGPFLPPQVHHRHAENGYAVSEFPIVYFLAAKGYDWFGFHDYYIRWIHYVIFILGLIYLVRITALFTQNRWLQLVPMAFTITSPYLYYYGANFLPDVAGLSIALIGLYYYFKFSEQHTWWYLALSVSLFTLATCLKVSAGILFLSCFGHYFFSILFPFIRTKNYRKPIVHLLVFGLGFALCYAWVQYDRYVAERYHFGGNLFGFYGIWDCDTHTILYIFKRLKELWVKVIFSKYLWISMGVFTVLFIRYFKQIDSRLRLITLFGGIGVVLFSLGWFKTFDVHDYYMINLFCLPILLFLCFIFLVEKKQWFSARYQYPLFIVLLGAIFYHSLLKCRGEQHFRFNDPVYNTLNPSLYRIEPYLRSIGIKRTDTVVSVPDPSPNISLYLMNQVGYSEAYTDEHYNIDVFVGMSKAKYLIVNDSNYCSKPPYDKYCRRDNLVGQFEGIKIFKTN